MFQVPYPTPNSNLNHDPDSDPDPNPNVVNYPMETFKNPSGGNEPGIAALVQKAIDTDADVMTLEEVQRLGAVDPVGIQVDLNEADWLSLEKPEGN